MAKVCQVTGKRVLSGHNVSHANNKTKRRFLPTCNTAASGSKARTAGCVCAYRMRGCASSTRRVSTSFSPICASAAKSEGTQAMREKIKLESTAGTGHFYTTTKNKRSTPDKLEFKKYDPVARKHVVYKETKIK